MRETIFKWALNAGARVIHEAALFLMRQEFWLGFSLEKILI